MTTEALFRTLREATKKLDIALALERVAKHESPVPLDPLIVNYLHDKRWLVRQGAIEALGNCPDPEAVILLHEAGRGTTDPFDLAYLNAALGRLQARTAIGFLRENVKHPKEDVATSALAALAAVGSVKELPCFLEALADRRWVVKWHAMLAIERHGDATAIPPVLARLKQILAKERRIQQASRSELASGLAFLWRHRGANEVVIQFFEQYLPARTSMLTPDELTELARLQNR